MSQVLLYNGERQHTLSIDAKRNVRLVPGKNVVSDEDVKALLDKKTGSAGFKHLCECGDIEVLDETVVGDDGSILLSEMSVKEIIMMIEAEPDADVLNGYLQQEMDGKQRDGAIKAINAQLETLGAAEDNPEE